MLLINKIVKIPTSLILELLEIKKIYHKDLEFILKVQIWTQPVVHLIKYMIDAQDNPLNNVLIH